MATTDNSTECLQILYIQVLNYQQLIFFPTTPVSIQSEIMFSDIRAYLNINQVSLM